MVKDGGILVDLVARVARSIVSIPNLEEEKLEILGLSCMNISFAIRVTSPGQRRE